MDTAAFGCIRRSPPPRMPSSAETLGHGEQLGESGSANLPAIGLLRRDLLERLVKLGGHVDDFLDANAKGIRGGGSRRAGGHGDGIQNESHR